MVNGDYPPDWRSRRAEVFQRDGYACQGCGEKGADRGDAELVAYHLVPRERGGTHDTMNLLALCRRCKHAFSEGETDTEPEIDVPVTRIEDLEDLRRAVAYIDDLETHVAAYAKQVFSDGEVDEGEIVRNTESFRLDAREVKQRTLTVRFMFTNLRLDADSQAQRDAYEKLADRVLFLLRYQHELVNHFLDFVDVLTTVKCPKCGYDADRDSKLCGECSRELPVHWECLQCRTDIDTLDEDYCSACGNELPELPPEQQQELDDVRTATQRTIREWRAQLNEVTTVMQNDLVTVQNAS